MPLLSNSTTTDLTKSQSDRRHGPPRPKRCGLGWTMFSEVVFKTHSFSTDRWHTDMYKYPDSFNSGSFQLSGARRTGGLPMGLPESSPPGACLTGTKTNWGLWRSETMQPTAPKAPLPRSSGADEVRPLESSTFDLLWPHRYLLRVPGSWE